MSLSFLINPLVIDFALAVTSGAVAGLIAGWVLLRYQLKAQVSNDDFSRILELRHSLESQAVALDNAAIIAWGAKRDNIEASRLNEAVSELMAEAGLLLWNVSLKAQYLQAEKYKYLRAYLVLRIRGGRFQYEENTLQMLTNLNELIGDITLYVRYPQGYRWFSLLLSRLNKDETALLLKATERPLYFHQESREVFKKLGLRTAGQTLDALVKRGLLEDKDGYKLTRSGWKRAVLLMKGQIDPRAGLTRNWAAKR